MIVTKKAIPRRAMLRGLGATIALPFLDSMVSAFTPLSKSAARPATRFGIVYMPMGAVMNNWTPATDGRQFALPPILQPLERFRDGLLVLSGLDNEPAVALLGEPAGGHGRIGAAFLTGVHAKPTEGADFEAGTSVDQIAARHLAAQTQLASLELGLEATGLMGACDVGYSCAYVNTLCWRGPKTPLPMENNPRAVFERLFGDNDSTDGQARRARGRHERSLLDSVTESAADLQRSLGPRDRSKLAEYLESIRDIERRIQLAEGENARELPVVERPGGIPATFADHAKVMFDLQILAFQSDLTRVSTIMLGRELSSRTYPEIGVPDQHHPLSHHQEDPAKLEKLTRINVFHTSLFAYYLERLQSTADGDGTLFDHSMVMYGSGMSDSNLHVPHRLPILLAGKASGQIVSGRHVRYREGTPLANLYLAILNKLGVPAERVGNSDGQLEHLSDV